MVFSIAKEVDYPSPVMGDRDRSFIERRMIRSGLVIRDNNAWWHSSHLYVLSKIEDDMEAYVKSCMVCQLDKIEMKKAIVLL